MTLPLPRSEQGADRYAAGEQDVYLADNAQWATGVRGALYLHGANADHAACRDYANLGELHLVNAVAELFPVLSIDAGGPTAMGNDTAIARIGDAVSYLQGARGAKAGKVILIGSSMGVLGALNYARANPTKVAAVLGVIPAIDLHDIVVNDRAGLAAAANASYGGTYSELTHGPMHNPASYAAFFTVPTRLYYASDDAAAIPSAALAFTAACTSARAFSLGALGHTQAAIDAVPRAEVLRWLRQFA